MRACLWRAAAAPCSPASSRACGLVPTSKSLWPLPQALYRFAEVRVYRSLDSGLAGHARPPLNPLRCIVCCVLCNISLFIMALRSLSAAYSSALLLVACCLITCGHAQQPLPLRTTVFIGVRYSFSNSFTFNAAKVAIGTQEMQRRALQGVMCGLQVRPSSCTPKQGPQAAGSPAYTMPCS